MGPCNPFFYPQYGFDKPDNEADSLLKLFDVWDAISPLVTSSDVNSCSDFCFKAPNYLCNNYSYTWGQFSPLKIFSSLTVMAGCLFEVGMNSLLYLIAFISVHS